MQLVKFTVFDPAMATLFPSGQPYPLDLVGNALAVVMCGRLGTRVEIRLMVSSQLLILEGFWKFRYRPEFPAAALALWLTDGRVLPRIYRSARRPWHVPRSARLPARTRSMSATHE